MNTDAPTDAPTDLSLLTAWRAGASTAGSALVRRYFATLSRFFATRAGQAKVDLMQRTWLGCVESRDRVPDGVPFKLYLLGIARRVLIHHYREQGRGRIDLALVGQQDSGVSPSRNLALADEQRLLLQALRRLPLDMQLTLELYYWEGLTIVDVATVLEVPPGTIKSRLSRAKLLLREQITALDPPPELLASTQADLERWAVSIRRFLGRDD